MKYLVIGSGGREHAIVSKLACEDRVTHIYAAPGNPGIEAEAPHVELLDIQSDDVRNLISQIKQKAIDIVIIGPEYPLAMGIVDELQKEGIKVFGPDKQATLLESSKSYAKELMKKYDIPVGEYCTFTQSEEAAKYIKGKNKYPLVIKADGLAGGKGVAIAKNQEYALGVIEEYFDGKFGDAGKKIVIEEFLDGEELSVFAFVDGHSIKYFTNARDHKSAYEKSYTGDNPMTGGMGTISPIEVDPKLHRKIDTIIQKTGEMIHGENMNYRGVIFIGLIIVDGGAYVIEYNVRFGDPEVQSMLARMKSSLSEAIEATIDDRLDEVVFEFEGKAMCLVLTAPGYPGDYKKGGVIKGIEDVCDVHVVHAGTKLEEGILKADGGRVLGLVGAGYDFGQIRKVVYGEVDKLTVDGRVFDFRYDIGK